MIERRLARVLANVGAAAKRSGRNPEDVTLVPISKRQSLDTIRAALDAGVLVLGENQVQEGEEKQRALDPERRLEWHLVGPLQSNKVRRAAAVFDVFHAVDRIKIARRLDTVAQEVRRSLRCFVEINLGVEPNKHGLLPTDLKSIEAISGYESLDVLGLMAIPPREDDAERSRRWFAELRELSERCRELGALPGTAGSLSMGMSADYEIAIEEGATHVRVGTSLFGERPEATPGG